MAASIVSVILAGFAIWLSVTFYKMSTATAESTREAAREIVAGVRRLEKLFDRLYGDTFDMMKETVSDMSKHIWPTPGTDTSNLIEERANEKAAQLKEQFRGELSSILSTIGKTDQKIEAVRSRLESLVDSVISQSRAAEKEARKDTVRNTVMEALDTLASVSRRTTMYELVDFLGWQADRLAVIKELFRLRDEGIVALPEDVKDLGDLAPSTPVILRKTATF